MKRFELWVSLIVVCLALSIVAFPQASSSSLRGTVTDPSGSALPGATVIIANAESKTTRTATTGGLGDYRFLAVPPGTYTLTDNWASSLERAERCLDRIMLDSDDDSKRGDSSRPRPNAGHS